MPQLLWATPMKTTPLMVFYGVFAVAGAIVPWVFNVQSMVETRELLTPHGLIAGGFVTPMSSSLTADFLIGTTPVLVWMMIEAKRLGMRNRWLYFGATFLIAFAFACPFFLMMRERKLQQMRMTDNLAEPYPRVRENA